MTLEKTNTPGYSKDKRTGVVINTSSDEYSSFKKQKQSVLEKKALEKKVVELEKELAEQKLLMTKILLEIGMLR